MMMLLDQECRGKCARWSKQKQRDYQGSRRGEKPQDKKAVGAMAKKLDERSRRFESGFVDEDEAAFVGGDAGMTYGELRAANDRNWAIGRIRRQGRR